MAEKHTGQARLVMLLLVIGILARIFYVALVIWPHHPPFAGDPSYMDDARNIVHLNFRALGDRTPAYPLLLALCGLNGWVVWAVQSVMGLVLSLMIFDMALCRTRSGEWSLLIGLACSLIPNVLTYEPFLLSEMLATFLVVAAVWLMTRDEGAEPPHFGHPLGVGLLAALAGLTRPLLLCLVPVYFCFVALPWPPANIWKRPNLKKALLFAAPVIVLVLGWCEFNYLNHGFFTPTTRAGQQLMDQVAPYVELAPDRFAVLRDTWLKYRPENETTDLDPQNYTWDALPEMEARTGKSEMQLLHELTLLALDLEIHHPLLCLRRAEQGWIQFWGEASSDEIDWPQGLDVGLIEVAKPVGKFLVREVMGIFLVLALFSIPCALLRSSVFTRIDYLIFAITLWASIFSSFTEFGNNFRFSVPFMPLIFYTVMTWGWASVRSVVSSRLRAMPSFVSQGDHGIHLHGSARGDVASQQPDQNQQCGSGNEHQGVVRPDSEQ